MRLLRVVFHSLLLLCLSGIVIIIIISLYLFLFVLFIIIMFRHSSLLKQSSYSVRCQLLQYNMRCKSNKSTVAASCFPSFTSVERDRRQIHHSTYSSFSIPPSVATSTTFPSSSVTSSLPSSSTCLSTDSLLSYPDWEVVIGLEVHAQIISSSKLCSPAALSFGASPNSLCSIIDAALPGTLPSLNKECIAQTIRTGMGLHGQVQTYSRFDRKQYFYCDMPQGYQITQQDGQTDRQTNS